MRKIIALSLLLCLSITFVAYAANFKIKISDAAWAEIGFRARSFDNQPRYLSALVVGKNLMDKHIVNRVGGVIFLEVASPAPALKGVCPQLKYDASKEMGARVTATFTGRSGTVEMADWEIKPIASYVENKDNGLISLYKPYSRDEFDGQLIEINRFVEDKLPGYILLLADSVRRVDFVDAIAILKDTPIAGFNRRLDGSPLQIDVDAVRAAQSAVRDSMGGAQLMFTDWKQSFVFDVQGNKLTISGAPYYLPLTKASNGDGIPLWDRAMNKLDDQNRLLKDASPIYGGAYRFARNSAFFRYLKENCSKEWGDFVSFLRNDTEIDSIEIETPVAVVPIN